MPDWLRFHPEVTPAIMENWVRGYRHELDEDEVDRDWLLEEMYSRAKSSWATSRALFDAFLERVAGFGWSG